MALYKGANKVAGSAGAGFTPGEGTVGQVLTKTASGYDWETPQTITVDSALSDSSENPVQNKVINSALQNLSVASDHLEEKALVGELYTLSDDMFIQATPALDDSTLDQNVGNTASNTQIHIQRVASGTVSNQLKLKIKKVGSPGNLTVQVMKGISVTVTADVEAYWYGDSNNVLATGSITASNVTTSYQELTVTLNTTVGGTRGDLLDIVLSQSSVDASNYYVIACDSTQWSEGFSFVSVNGNTRTRSKLMPYCISDGFAQSLLSKVSNDTVTANLNYNYTGTEQRGRGLLEYNIFTSPIKGAINYSYSFYWDTELLNAGSAGTMYLNDNQIDYQSNMASLRGTHTGTVSVEYGGNIVVKVTPANQVHDWNEFLYRINNIVISYSGNIDISKGGDIIGIPREVSNLGIDASITTFGRHIDGTRVTNY